MGSDGIELAVAAGGLAAVWGVLVAGIFVGLTPGAYLTGPAVLGYLNVNAGNRRVVLLRRATAYVIGAAIPMAAFGLLVGFFGDVVLAVVGARVALWYLLVALVVGVNGLLLTGLIVARLPAYLPRPHKVASARASRGGSRRCRGRSVPWSARRSQMSSIISASGSPSTLRMPGLSG